MIKFNKGTIFKNIPQGFDENGNLKYVDRPLLNDLIITEEDVGEVLKEYEAHQTPVPSYDEWQASENYIDYLKQCISVYESKDKQATETSIAYNELLEENTKLKELLKECIPYFNALVEKRLKLEYIPQVYELLTKINEVLK